MYKTKTTLDDLLESNIKKTYSSLKCIASLYFLLGYKYIGTLYLILLCNNTFVQFLSTGLSFLIIMITHNVK